MEEEGVCAIPKVFLLEVLARAGDEDDGLKKTVIISKFQFCICCISVSSEKHQFC